LLFVDSLFTWSHHVDRIDYHGLLIHSIRSSGCTAILGFHVGIVHSNRTPRTLDVGSVAALYHRLFRLPRTLVISSRGFLSVFCFTWSLLLVATTRDSSYCGIHEPTPVVSTPPDSNSPVLLRYSCSSTNWPLFRSSVFLFFMLIHYLLWLSLHSCKLNRDRVASFQSTLRSSSCLFRYATPASSIACLLASVSCSTTNWLCRSFPHCRSLWIY
jgi:hypothetical protein